MLTLEHGNLCETLSFVCQNFHFMTAFKTTLLTKPQQKYLTVESLLKYYLP